MLQSAASVSQPVGFREGAERGRGVGLGWVNLVLQMPKKLEFWVGDLINK